MIKRVTWFVAGAATGAAGAVAAGRRVRRAAERLLPTNVARQAASTVARKKHAVAAAVREGKAAMIAKEHELRARRDGHPVVGGLGPTDGVLVAGPVIEAEVRDLDSWRGSAGRARLHRSRRRA
jgi:hypothetical protein